MKQVAKLILGLVTLLPILFFISFFVYFQLTFFSDLFSKNSFFDPRIEAAVMFSTIGFIMFLSYGLTAFYIVNVFINKRVDKDKKALWAVVIFLGWAVAQLVYWYLYIWRQPKTITQETPSPIP